MDNSLPHGAASWQAQHLPESALHAVRLIPPAPNRCFVEGSVGISEELSRSVLEVRVTNAGIIAWVYRKGVVFTFSRSAFFEGAAKTAVEFCFFP